MTHAGTLFAAVRKAELRIDLVQQGISDTGAQDSLACDTRELIWPTLIRGV